MTLAWVYDNHDWHAADSDAIVWHPNPCFSSLECQSLCGLSLATTDQNHQMAASDPVRRHPTPVCPDCLRLVLDAEPPTPGR